MKKNLKAVVNNKNQYDLDIEDSESLDIVQYGPINLHILKDNQKFDIDVVSFDLNSKSYDLLVNGKSFTVQLKNELDLQVEKMGLNSVQTKKVDKIKAPMPGLVLDVLVEPDEKVVEGTSLVILEAMKMENILKAPADMEVKSIAIKKGDTVEKGAILIELK